MASQWLQNIQKSLIKFALKKLHSFLMQKIQKKKKKFYLNCDIQNSYETILIFNHCDFLSMTIV